MEDRKLDKRKGYHHSRRWTSTAGTERFYADVWSADSATVEVAVLTLIRRMSRLEDTHDFVVAVLARQVECRETVFRFQRTVGTRGDQQLHHARVAEID